MQIDELTPVSEFASVFDRINENPAIDTAIVSDSISMREELERMGVWVDHGPRVRDYPEEGQNELQSVLHNPRMLNSPIYSPDE